MIERGLDEDVWITMSRCGYSYNYSCWALLDADAFRNHKLELSLLQDSCEMESESNLWN